VAGDAGFGADRRLRAAEEFKAVFSQRRVLRGESFHLHYRPNGGDSARLGLVIAKKLARRAVWRNAIKRTGRETFRHKRAGLPPLDLVLRLAKPVAGADAAARRAWRSEIADLLDKLPR
jgi:ribonuclease P protein component